MQEIDFVIRVAAGTLALLFSVVMFRDFRQRPASCYGILVAIGVCAFLIGNASTNVFPNDHVAGLVRDILSGHLAIFLWWFCLSIFDEGYRVSSLELGVALLWMLLFGLEFLQTVPDNLSFVRVVLGLCIVGHIAWHLISDKPNDLVEKRRKSRYAVAVIPTSLLLIDLLIDLIFGFNWKPQAFLFTQNLSIFALILGLCLWGLETSTGKLLFAENSDAPRSPSEITMSAEDRKLVARIRSLMTDDQIFLNPDLRLLNLASAVGIGEARLRRVISEGFDSRNFRHFLNAYRINFACQKLSDPAHAKDKILSIAMDSGFASLASFNRAFKMAKGCSPSAYREASFAEEALHVSSLELAASERSKGIF